MSLMTTLDATLDAVPCVLPRRTVSAAGMPLLEGLLSAGTGQYFCTAEVGLDSTGGIHATSVT